MVTIYVLVPLFILEYGAGCIAIEKGEERLGPLSEKDCFKEKFTFHPRYSTTQVSLAFRGLFFGLCEKKQPCKDPHLGPQQGLYCAAVSEFELVRD